MKIDLIMNAGRIMRYHAAPIERKQSVAEHCWGVTVILLQIYPACPIEVMHYAIHHDLGELYTGDIPSPVKRASRKLVEELEVLEEVAYQDMGIQLADLSPEDLIWVKRADYIEGVLYCESRIRLGDLNAIPVRDQYMVYLTKLDYSMEEFYEQCK